MSAFRGRSRRTAASSSTPLEGLLNDVRELRLTLAADLNAAAGAADAGEPGVAADIVDADRRELAHFGRMAELRIAMLHRADEARERPQWRRRVAYALPAVPLVGAMAVSAAAVTGVLPTPGPHSTMSPPQATATSPASDSFNDLVAVVDGDPSASQVIAAAKRLHRQIAALIAATPGNPAGAAEVAELLRMEQSLLLRAQPPGASVVLDATRRLAAQLVTKAPSASKPTRPADVPTKLPSPTPSTTKSPSPSPTAKKTSSPKPTSSSSASGGASDPSQIPAIP